MVLRRIVMRLMGSDSSLTRSSMNIQTRARSSCLHGPIVSTRVDIAAGAMSAPRASAWPP